MKTHAHQYLTHLYAYIHTHARLRQNTHTSYGMVERSCVLGGHCSNEIHSICFSSTFSLLFFPFDVVCRLTSLVSNSSQLSFIDYYALRCADTVFLSTHENNGILLVLISSQLHIYATTHFVRRAIKFRGLFFSMCHPETLCYPLNGKHNENEQKGFFGYFCTFFCDATKIKINRKKPVAKLVTNRTHIHCINIHSL